MSTKLVALSPPTSLAQVLERIAAMDSLPSQKRHDLMSSIRRVTRLLDSLPADIPADPEALKRRLGILTPAAAGMTRGRWRNVRALLTAALALTGAKVMRGRRRDALMPQWLVLFERVSDRYERARLSRFFSYASANGIGPNDVDDRTVADFAESLKRNSLLDRQTEIVRGLCLAWNRCAEKIEGWPAARVAVPNSRRDYALPPTTYPPSFDADVHAYLAHLAGGDLFNSTGRGPASPATLRDLRVRLFEMAAALVRSGRVPERIGSLADLVAPNALQTALTFVWARNGKRKTGHLHNFALTALKIAKYWVKAPSEQIAALQAIRRQVDPQNMGMTEGNRARLRQFDDPENLRRLINLPETIRRSLPRTGSVAYAAAVRVQSALAIGILLVAPMRMKNLASLHLDRHLSRTRPGGVRHIVIPAEEVKNLAPLSFEIPGPLGELLDFYLARCRPILSKDSNGYLFPSLRHGGAKPSGHLGTQIKRTIAREAGIILNPHAFRHLSAKLFLAAHPGEYETVRLFLGHKCLNTTVRAYCGLEQADALRRLDALIDRHRNNPGDRHDSPPAHR
jgi:integrase